MINIYKISTIVLMSVIMVISSCKKDSDDDDPVVLTPIYGCTDILAFNFISPTGDPLIDVNTDDGSCIYAYDIAQGVWNITPDCDEYTIPVIGTTISLNDQLPETIDVQAAQDNSLYIEIGDTEVNGTIDNLGNIVVPEQTISLDMGFGPMDIDVEGDGLINTSTTGNMNLTYSFEIEAIPGLPAISESLECYITLDK